MQSIGLLGLHTELLQSELLPRLSFTDLGALLRTCKALRNVVQDAPDSVLLGAARRSLPGPHPLFRAPSARQYLRDQGRIAAAVSASASPQAWTQEDAPALNSERLTYAPDFTMAAALCAGRLVVWALPCMQGLASIPVPTPEEYAWRVGSTSCCVWSDCSQVVAFVHACGKLALINTSSGHSCVVDLGVHSSLDLSRFLPSQQSLLVPASKSLIVSLKADGSFARQELPMRAFDVWCSPLGAVAYTPVPNTSTLRIWQGGDEVEVKLRDKVGALAWAPCGSQLLCWAALNSEFALARFVSAEGQLLARVHVRLPQTRGADVLWGRLGVLHMSLCAEQSSTCIHYFAVQPGHRLQLLHRVETPASPSALVLSPDQAHFALLSETGAVSVLPASAALAQLRDWSRLSWPATPGPGHGHQLSWLSDGSALLCQTKPQCDEPDRARLVRFVRL